MDCLFNIVLIEPEIPQNTGNIGRTCVATQCHLHLVGQMGFEITDAQVKRAGLDYWPYLTWKHHETFEAWMACVPDQVEFFISRQRQKRSITKFSFKKAIGWSLEKKPKV